MMLVFLTKEMMAGQARPAFLANTNKRFDFT